MSTQQKELLGSCDKGHRGSPGTQYTTKQAAVYRLKSGRYECIVTYDYGSNQGYLERHGGTTRRYRAASLDELMRITISELKSDSELSDSAYQAAVREAIFEAEDTESD